MNRQNGSGNVGGQRRRLLAAMETGGTGFSASAAEHAWRPPHLHPLPLPLPHGERKRERSVAGAKEDWHPLTQWLHGTVRAR